MLSPPDPPLHSNCQTGEKFVENGYPYPGVGVARVHKRAETIGGVTASTAVPGLCSGDDGKGCMSRVALLNSRLNETIEVVDRQ